MSQPTTLVQQFGEFPNAYRLTAWNLTTTKLKAYTFVVLDSNNLLADANALQQGIAVAAPSGTDGSVGVIGVLTEDLDYVTDSLGGQPTAGMIPCGPVVPMTSDGAITAGGGVMCTTDASAGHLPGMAKAQSGSRPCVGLALNTSADLEVVFVMLLGRGVTATP